MHPALCQVDMMSNLEPALYLETMSTVAVAIIWSQYALYAVYIYRGK